MARVNCVVVTPEETALETEADFVVVPMYDGELGIGSNHSPMIGRLGFGELRLKDGGSVVRYYVDGGFTQIVDNNVSVLTGRMVPAADIDVAAAESQLADARKRPANTPELYEIRERLIAQARAQLRVAAAK